MILLNKAYAYPYQNGIFRAYCSIEGSVIGGLIISSRSHAYKPGVSRQPS